jgi:hypothetical protein
LAQIIAFREKSMEQFAERIASLEADNARLRERADAAEGLAGAIRGYLEWHAWAGSSSILMEQKFNAALAAYKQAQGG